MNNVNNPKMEPKVFFDPLVLQKIMHWVHKATGEVSGLGKIEINADGDILVTSAILVEQQNGATSTDMNPEDVAKAMFFLKDEPGELRFWWHSHVNMPVFWSGTDTDTMEKLGEHGWFLSTVFNKKNESRTAIYQKKPYRMFKDDIRIFQMNSVPKDVVDSWDAEFEKKCKSSRFEDYRKRYASEKTQGKESEKTTSQTTTDADDDYYYSRYGYGDDDNWRYDPDKSSPSSSKVANNKSVEAHVRISDDLRNLLDVPPAFMPIWFDEEEVYCTNNTTMTRSIWEKRFSVNLSTADVMEHLNESELPSKAN